MEMPLPPLILILACLAGLVLGLAALTALVWLLRTRAPLPSDDTVEFTVSTVPHTGDD